MTAYLIESESLTSSTLSYTLFHNVAKHFEPYTIHLRRRLHKIPEIGWEETKTLALIKEEIYLSIKNSPYESLRIQEGAGGIWIDLLIDRSFPFLLFRADIDALPIQEDTNLPFASEHPGKMHACGHDCHAAMLLSAFRAIVQGYVIPKTNIRFVWQRAEEYAQRRSGGEKLVQEGICTGIDAVHALHISSVYEKGVFYSRPGVMMSNAALVCFGIECSGGHVMRPHYGTNAIHVMIDIENTLRGYDSLFFGPEEPIAFVPSIVNAGVATNVRPNYVEMTFAIRNFLSQEKRSAFVESIKHKVELITKLYPTAELSFFDFEAGYPTLSTDPDTTQDVKEMIHSLGFATQTCELLFCGEDFAYYLQKVPGTFWCLGASQGKECDHHTPKFNPSESVFWQGVAFWLALSQGRSLDS